MGKGDEGQGQGTVGEGVEGEPGKQTQQPLHQHCGM